MQYFVNSINSNPTIKKKQKQTHLSGFILIEDMDIKLLNFLRQEISSLYALNTKLQWSSF